MSCSSKEQKETVMVLKVDLDCEKCYKKVKKVLCKFPHIRNQVYDAKNNTVTITVLCCSPEKIRDKLYCKAGKSIKCIEIKQQSKPKPKPAPEPEKPPENPPKNGKPDPPPPPKPPAHPPVCCAPCSKCRPGPPCQHTGPPAPKPPAPPPVCCDPCSKGRPGPPCHHTGPPAPKPPAPPPVCCAPCYEGRPEPPCYQTGPPGPPYLYGCYGRPCPPPCYGSCCNYFCEENPSSCSIM